MRCRWLQTYHATRWLEDRDRGTGLDWMEGKPLWVRPWSGIGSHDTNRKATCSAIGLTRLRKASRKWNAPHRRSLVWMGHSRESEDQRMSEDYIQGPLDGNGQCSMEASGRWNTLSLRLWRGWMERRDWSKFDGREHKAECLIQGPLDGIGQSWMEVSRRQNPIALRLWR